MANKTTMVKLKGQNKFCVKSLNGKTARRDVKKRIGKCGIVKDIKKSPSWAGDETKRNMYWVNFKKKC